jgi:hypothetical protein
VKHEYAEQIVAAMGDDFDEESSPEVTVGYSGRGMYGRTTSAVVCPSLGVFVAAACYVAADLVEDGESEEFARAMKKISIDQMGKSGIVVY